MSAGLLDFVADIGGELGDSRRISRAAEYVEALLIESPEPKSFAQLARLVVDENDGDDPYKLEQAFQHLVNGSSWDPDDLLRPAAERIAQEIDVKAMMLLAVVFPRLGEHTPQYPDHREGGRQVASVIQMVGVDRSGEPAILPFRWRLSLEEERWRSRIARERAEVDYAVGVHISVHGRQHAAVTQAWDLPKVPLVAGPSYEWLRAHWLREHWLGGSEWRYVVELPEKAIWDSTEQLETLLATRPDEPVLEGAAIEIGEASAPAPGSWSLYSVSGELGRERVVVCEQGEKQHPFETRAWCTNLPVDTDSECRDLVGLAELRLNAQAFWDELRYGLLGAAGYRGLSVKGWERHCALVTAAQAYRIHAGIPEPSTALRLPAGRARPGRELDWRAAVRDSPLPSTSRSPAGIM